METQTTQKNNVPKKGGFSTTKRKVLFSLFAIFILTVSFAGISFAKKIHDLKKEGPIGILIDKVTEGMTLSNQQKAQLTALKTDIRTKMESKKPVRKEKFDRFINEFRKDNLDKTSLENMFQQNQNERNEMRDFAENKIVEFHNILTPEQRVQAADKMTSLREKIVERIEKFNPEK